MANKKSASTNKHKPTSLGRSVIFGEERNGSTRITRPGTSPTSPPHKQYPITSPVRNTWLRPGSTAAPKKPSTEASELCQEHHGFPNVDLPTFDDSFVAADMASSDDHFEKLDLLNSLNSALVVTIMRRWNGDIEFRDGASWHKLPDNAEKRVQTDGSAVLSSPTAGFKTLPALLQNGNLVPNGDGFIFRDTKGWVRAIREGTCAGELIEKWVYLGEECKTPIEKLLKLGGDASGDDSKPIKCTNTEPKKPLMNCLRPSRPSRIGKTSTAAPKIAKSTSKKAKKNRKAREKKARVKRNIGKREKVPYIPEHALEEKTLTRSRAKSHHVHAKEFYALL
ncbi:hypothetical protein Slin15195_G058660 [Septoria linicola]|uniref:Uncharacterized protein n=1 Tax=Septoria linicola TaxID=215465 RepID=A0A9Q9EJU2_9PEZI|nr:hypothetical protein Slin14017_G074520 [Septoria linicola]USW52547.1 hypothetical protein Slin15195_G058660 [Septoria linicola]